MRDVTVELVEEVELSLPAFLQLGLSLGICLKLHLWPPLATMNAFLACGVDDLEDGRILRWSPFEVSDDEYRATLRECDANAKIDSLGTTDADWRSWFQAATRSPLPPA